MSLLVSTKTGFGLNSPLQFDRHPDPVTAALLGGGCTRPAPEHQKKIGTQKENPREQLRTPGSTDRHTLSAFMPPCPVRVSEQCAAGDPPELWIRRPGGGGGPSKNSQTTPGTTSTTSIRQLLGAADAQTAHHATSSTAPAHQPLGSANAATTPAGATAAAADRKQRSDAREDRVTVQGPVKKQQPDGTPGGDR